MKTKNLFLTLLLLGLFLILPTNNAFACSRSNEFYEMEPADFFKKAEIVFIGKVTSYDRDLSERYGDIRVSFEVLKQYKAEKSESIDIYLDDGSTCISDYFLRESEIGEIYTIMASKDNWKMNDSNIGKFTTIGDERVNQKFESESKAEEFIKKSCSNCKEISNTSETKKVKQENGLFKKIWNWILLLFKNLRSNA